MPVKRFRRLPTEIEAIQWTGDNLRDVEEFGARVKWSTIKPYNLMLRVEANKVWLSIQFGEWIARDFIGFYPIKHEAILKNYEEI